MNLYEERKGQFELDDEIGLKQEQKVEDLQDDYNLLETEEEEDLRKVL